MKSGMAECKVFKNHEKKKKIKAEEAVRERGKEPVLIEGKGQNMS